MNAPSSWDDLPLILHASDMARLFGVQVSTIWKRCASRRMRPKPWSWVRPYVWYRDAVRAEFERGIPTAPMPRRRGPTVTAAVPAAHPRDVREVSAELGRELARLERRS